jgi:hypothetical protein
MRSSSWVLALVVGCAHATAQAPARTSTKDAGETAVGAYLENPLPYLIASLGSCAFSGPVSKDLRATAAGSISARCKGERILRWNALPATSIQIDGPPTIRAFTKGLNYIYSVSYMAGAKRLAGRAETTWATAPECANLVELKQFNAATFVLPTGVGSCTLQARATGLKAELVIAIQ